MHWPGGGRRCNRHRRPRRALRLRQQRGRETGVFRREPVRRVSPSNASALQRQAPQSCEVTRRQAGQCTKAGDAIRTRDIQPSKLNVRGSNPFARCPLPSSGASLRPSPSEVTPSVARMSRIAGLPVVGPDWRVWSGSRASSAQSALASTHPGGPCNQGEKFQASPPVGVRMAGV